MPSHVLICIISGRVSIVHIFIPMRVSSFWKNIVNVQIWKPNMFLLLYIYFFPMRILNPNTKIKKEEPEAWMNICQLLFSYLMKIQWYKISLYRRKYMLTKKNPWRDVKILRPNLRRHLFSSLLSGDLSAGFFCLTTGVFVSLDLTSRDAATSLLLSLSHDTVQPTVTELAEKYYVNHADIFLWY